MRRATLGSPVSLTGRGLHSGCPASLRLRPAPPGTGIIFRRADLAGTEDIPALWRNVAGAELATSLGAGRARVDGVEHLMAAFLAVGVSDAVVEVEGPEIPVLDGSTAPFVAAMVAAGRKTHAVARRAIRILRPVRVRDRGRLAMLLPAPRFEMAFRIRFPDPAIGTQSLALALAGSAMVRELADSRTFGRLADVAELRRRGLAQGGHLGCAVVVDGSRVLNPGGLRRADEFVRHKMLDAAGDLALAGAPIIGRYLGICAGHDLTHRLLRRLFATPESYCWTSCHAGNVPEGAAAAPIIPLAEVSAVV